MIEMYPPLEENCANIILGGLGAVLNVTVVKLYVPDILNVFMTR